MAYKDMLKGKKKKAMKKKMPVYAKKAAFKQGDIGVNGALDAEEGGQRNKMSILINQINKKNRA